MSHPLNIWSFVGGVVGEFLEGFRWEFFLRVYQDLVGYLLGICFMKVSSWVR